MSMMLCGGCETPIDTDEIEVYDSPSCKDPVCVDCLHNHQEEASEAKLRESIDKLTKAIRMKDKPLNIRVSENDLKAWKDRASKEGITLSEYIRSACNNPQIIDLETRLVRLLNERE